MVNIVFITFSFLFLVYKKIFLLNEESLILLCFVTFIYFNLNYFGNYLHNSLKQQLSKIEQSLGDSLKQIFTLFFKFKNLKNDFNIALDKFVSLGNHYYRLTSLLVNSLPKFNNKTEIKIYKQRLEYLKTVEQQTSKVLSLIIIKKLSKIIELRQFYTNNIKFDSFLCSNAISTREYIQLINFKS